MFPFLLALFLLADEPAKPTKLPAEEALKIRELEVKIRRRTETIMKYNEVLKTLSDANQKDGEELKKVVEEIGSKRNCTVDESPDGLVCKPKEVAKKEEKK